MAGDLRRADTNADQEEEKQLKDQQPVHPKFDRVGIGSKR
jgi:hypothetical protein